MGCQNSKSNKKQNETQQKEDEKKQQQKKNIKHHGIALNVNLKDDQYEKESAMINAKTPAQRRYEGPKKKDDQETASKDNVIKYYNILAQAEGNGSFGTVRLSFSRQEQSRKFAIKTIAKERMGEKFYMLRRELEILKTLDHPNIIRLYEIFQDDKNFHFVMEYCCGGDLYKHVIQNGYMNEEYAAKIMQRAFSAVAHMHSKDVIHRDLKPENLMFDSLEDDPEIKIIDFGLSRIFQPDYLKSLPSVVGTPLYVAPEVIEETYYGKECDNWSLGVVLYFILCGKEPFYAKSLGEVYEKIRNAAYSFQGELWKSVSSEAKNLISKLLVVNPKKRMTAQQALQHPWFKMFDQNISYQGQVEENKELIQKYIKNMLSSGWDLSQFKVKREIVKIIMNHYLSDSQIKELHFVYRLFNLNSTGQLNLQEIYTHMKNLGLDNEENKKIMENIFDKMHIDQLYNSTQVQLKPQEKFLFLTEFMLTVIDLNQFIQNQEIQKSIFRFLDRSQTGEITIIDIKEIIAREGRKLQTLDLQEYFSEIYDGYTGSIINFEMFQVILKETDYKVAQSQINQINKKLKNK